MVGRASLRGLREDGREGGREGQPPHFSKHLSDPKLNGTQEKTPFSGTFFHTLSHGVLRFGASFASKTIV